MASPSPLGEGPPPVEVEMPRTSIRIALALALSVRVLSSQAVARAPGTACERAPHAPHVARDTSFAARGMAIDR